MYAIVEIRGKQFKVEQDQQLYVHRLEGDEGSKVAFDEVLLIDNNGKISVGTPVVEGAQVSAKIIRHLKDDTIIVFKKKRRKGYRVRNGHRQYLSEILIEKITEKGAKKASPEKQPAPAAQTTKAPAKKEAKTKEETKPGKKAATKKATAKKPAEKKAAKPKKENKKDK